MWLFCHLVTESRISWLLIDGVLAWMEDIKMIVPCDYIRQRSWANVMYSSPFVCLSVCLFVCLFVCLSVSRITQKVMDGFEQNIMGR